MLEQRIRDNYLRSTKWVRADDSPYAISPQLPLTPLEQAMRSASVSTEFGTDVIPVRDANGNPYRCEVRGRAQQGVILVWGCGDDEHFGTADDEYGISVDGWKDLTPFMPEAVIERIWVECGLQRPRRQA